MMNDRKVINLEEGWDFMQARPRETRRYSRERGSLRAASLAPVFRANVTLRGSDAAPSRARSDLLPCFAHEQKGIVKLRGILEKEQGEDAFTPQEYMNLYTCVPRKAFRVSDPTSYRPVHFKNAKKRSRSRLLPALTMTDD